jgi:hypothetical protein
VSSDQAVQMLALLQSLVDFTNAAQSFFEPVGGIGSAFLGLGFLVSFAHGFRAASRSYRSEV